MRVLIACEFSGIVRDAFASKGHDAWSCDILPSERPEGNHVQGDVLEIIGDGWDLMIAHPPCTDIALSGAAWFKKKGWKLQKDALEFFCCLLNAPIPQIAVENPRSIASSHIRSYDQVIHPWWFGCPERKTTWLWLKNLPRLKPTNVVKGRGQSIHREGPGPDRWRNRSRTFEGIALAMADQWDCSRYRDPRLFDDLCLVRE